MLLRLRHAPGLQNPSDCNQCTTTCVHVARAQSGREVWWVLLVALAAPGHEERKVTRVTLEPLEQQALLAYKVHVATAWEVWSCCIMLFILTSVRLFASCLG